MKIFSFRKPRLDLERCRPKGEKVKKGSSIILDGMVNRPLEIGEPTAAADHFPSNNYKMYE